MAAPAVSRSLLRRPAPAPNPPLPAGQDAPRRNRSEPAEPPGGALGDARCGSPNPGKEAHPRGRPAAPLPRGRDRASAIATGALPESPPCPSPKGRHRPIARCAPFPALAHPGSRTTDPSPARRPHPRFPGRTRARSPPPASHPSPFLRLLHPPRDRPVRRDAPRQPRARPGANLRRAIAKTRAARSQPMPRRSQARSPPRLWPPSPRRPAPPVDSASRAAPQAPPLHRPGRPPRSRHPRAMRSPPGLGPRSLLDLADRLLLTGQYREFRIP